MCCSRARLVLLACLVAFGWRGRAAVPAFIGQNFTGSVYGTDSLSFPPDSNGAVGPDHFVEFINGRFSAYSKTNGSRVLTQTDLAFWNAAGITLPTGYDLTDPRIVYDPSVQRWFAAQIDFDPSGAKNTNRFLLAISTTADPTGAWKGVAFLSDPNGVNFADFPALGLDANGVYLSGDLFNAAQTTVGPILVSIPKSDLLAATPSVARRTFFTGLSYSANGQILQPAVCVDGSATGAVLAVGDLGLDFVPHSTLKALTILNAASATASLSSAATVNVSAYSVPLNPTQPNGRNDLDDGDARFSAAVRVVGGVLYAVHGTEVNNLAALRWYRFSATNFAILESGTITNAVLDLFYPSIAVNAQGTVVITCNGCSLVNYVSSYAYVGQTVNGVTTFNNPLLLQSGTASYRNILAGDTSSRWGDYSATSVDPADPSRFWVIQMLPIATARWITQITEIITSPPPLSIARANTNALISWPGYASTMTLQANTNVVNTNTWVAVSQSPVPNGNQLTVTLPATNAANFFRLKLGP